MITPNIFGSGAATLGKSPFPQWEGIRKKPLFSGLGNRIVTIAKTKNDILDYVNTTVNRRIHYFPDYRGPIKKDHWEEPNRTLWIRRGDCEDIAIVKYKILQKIGFSEKYMFLSIGKTKTLYHAVLVVNYKGKFVFLDNRYPDVRETKAEEDFAPLFSMNERTWIHGVKHG